MWPDDEMWLPLMLAGKTFIASFLFKDHDEIISQRIVEADVPSLAPGCRLVEVDSRVALA